MHPFRNLCAVRIPPSQHAHAMPLLWGFRTVGTQIKTITPAAASCFGGESSRRTQRRVCSSWELHARWPRLLWSPFASLATLRALRSPQNRVSETFARLRRAIQKRARARTCARANPHTDRAPLGATGGSPAPHFNKRGMPRDLFSLVPTALSEFPHCHNRTRCIHSGITVLSKSRRRSTRM